MLLCLETQAFFFDNENAGSSRMNGYTLPGFWLRPHLDWRLGRRAEMQMGLHWLHFWGDHSPHDANEQGLFVTDFDSLKPALVTPWLRLRLTPSDAVTILLGCIDNHDGHHLPLPLYNFEHSFADNPEAGAQILLQLPWLTMDTWVDWQRFVWNRSAHHEVFFAGTTAELSTEGRRPSVEPTLNSQILNFQLHLPLHVVLQHLGGENLSDTTLEAETHLNAALGVGLSRQWGDLTLRADCMAMLYARTGGPEGDLTYVPNWEDWWYLASPRRNFKRGWGIYPRLTAQWRGIWAEASWWSSERFVPLLGSYHYSNVSVNTSDMTHDRIRVATLRGGWTWSPRPEYSLTLYAAWFHYFPYTADRTGYAKVHGKAADMFSFGLLVTFKPSLPLRF